MKLSNTFNTEKIVKRGVPVLIALTVMSMPVVALADGVTASALIGNIIATILDVFKYIGIILLCWACGQMFLAFKNEDSDSKSRAAFVIVASVLLIAFGQGFKAFLESTGTGVNVGTSMLN